MKKAFILEYLKEEIEMDIQGSENEVRFSERRRETKGGESERRSR